MYLSKISGKHDSMKWRSLVQTLDGLYMTFYYGVTEARGLSLEACIVFWKVPGVWSPQINDLAFISNLSY